MMNKLDTEENDIFKKSVNNKFRKTKKYLSINNSANATNKYTTNKARSTQKTTLN
jgi:hypothetical protein